ncbi:MAG: sensor histidine kinase [Catenulispora sp.]
MRERPAVPVSVLLAAAVVALFAADLVWTAVDAGSSSTSMMRVPPVLEVCLLALAAVAAMAVGIRWRRSAETAAAVAAVSEAEADRLLKAIDSTSAVIYMRDSAGRYLLVNRQYEQLFDVRREDIIGLTDHDLFPKEVADDFRANDLKALAHGAPMQMEEVAPHPDGPHTYITVKYPITDLEGRTMAICGISTDITALKRAEERERRLNTELEARVRSRTAELEASTRELDAFAYSVSHDLRAPLRAVAGFSEVLLEECLDQLDEQGKDYLHRVVAATERMGQLIDDLLNLSRATRAELTRQPVDLTVIARRVIADLALTGPPRPLPDLDVQIDEGLRAVCDPALLELVLRNLAANAWKFSAKQDRPRIHFGSVQQNGARAFFVADNGAGFDPRYADKLFVPFQRLHTVKDFPGSGIGLAIVARIIARHGGRVWADSPGGGAVFYFTLPDHPDHPSHPDHPDHRPDHLEPAAPEEGTAP